MVVQGLGWPKVWSNMDPDVMDRLENGGHMFAQSETAKYEDWWCSTPDQEVYSGAIIEAHISPYS